MRFTAYSTLKVSVHHPRPLSLLCVVELIVLALSSRHPQSFVSGNARPGESLPAGVTFGIGAVAGVITVYTTMPLECVCFLLSLPLPPLCPCLRGAR